MIAAMIAEMIVEMIVEMIATVTVIATAALVDRPHLIVAPVGRTGTVTSRTRLRHQKAGRSCLPRSPSAPRGPVRVTNRLAAVVARRRRRPQAPRPPPVRPLPLAPARPLHRVEVIVATHGSHGSRPSVVCYFPSLLGSAVNGIGTYSAPIIPIASRASVSMWQPTLRGAGVPALLPPAFVTASTHPMHSLEYDCIASGEYSKRCGVDSTVHQTVYTRLMTPRYESSMLPIPACQSQPHDEHSFKAAKDHSVRYFQKHVQHTAMQAGRRGTR